MSHHLLHVEREHRLSILIDLTSAPGRTIVFTRTKHAAKALARQLNRSGVPAVELHGNLGQNARTRNLQAFHDGGAATMVATDIAARGIHVDDVSLVVHADPPVEHKAYLHRSGRTARAGNAGTVITLMTSDQVGDVRRMTRAAGLRPETTRIPGSSHPVLAELAPGERVLAAATEAAVTAPAQVSTRSRGRGRGAAGSRSTRGRGGAAAFSAGSRRR
jgi:superfamily II DNA/RNA helicase